MPNISVVLVGWKRPLGPVLKHLQSNPLFDDVVVWENTDAKNVGVWGRWLAVKECKNDIIYTQDDDCLIHNIDDIWRAWDGTCLANGLKPAAIESYKNRNHTLVGWGAFFRKDWVSVMHRYLEEYGEDNILHTNADRIMTALWGKPYNTVAADVYDFETATDPSISMSLQKGFIEDTEEAMRRLETIL